MIFKGNKVLLLVSEQAFVQTIMFFEEQGKTLRVQKANAEDTEHLR